MSDLVPSIIPLNKGIDLQTPKITAEPGTVLSSLNYEQVDFQGQKRIDGFTRYDGNTPSAFDEYYALSISPLPSASTLDLVFIDQSVFAVVVDENDAGDIIIVIINDKIMPASGDTVQFLNRTTGVLSASHTLVSITDGTSRAAGDPDLHYNNLLSYHTVLRQNVEALPGPIAGLHWFRDRLYAVADVVAVSLKGTTPAIYPNDVLSNGVEGTKVLDAFTLANTRLLFISSFDTAGLWQIEGTAITRDGVSVGTIANGFEAFPVSTEIASFFESRTEQQAIDEDGIAAANYGWRFKDLGWRIRYEDGVSLYGSLPSLNQNIDGLGVQGPTSTAGNRGKPMALVQNVTIENEQVQVNGWKSSQTPTTYDLDVDNVTDVDGSYIYADAFISWSADSSIVSSPGLTSNTLEARDATASVTIEIA